MNYLDEMADQGYNYDNITHFHMTMIPWLYRRYKIPKDAIIVDIGSGQGHGIVPLFVNGWENIVAVDKYDNNFSLFRNKFGAKTICCDIETNKINMADDSVDVIMCFHLIEHLSKNENLLSEISRILRKGGIIFLVSPDWKKQYKNFYGDPTHVRPYDKESIARLFRIYNFDAKVFSWGSRFGFGRMRIYKYIPCLGLIGENMLLVATKP